MDQGSPRICIFKKTVGNACVHSSVRSTAITIFLPFSLGWGEKASRGSCAECERQVSVHPPLGLSLSLDLAEGDPIQGRVMEPRTCQGPSGDFLNMWHHM